LLCPRRTGAGDILQQILPSVRRASRIRRCRCCTSISTPASSSAPSAMAAVSGPGRGGHVRIGRRHGARRCSVRRRGLLLRRARRTLLGFALEDGRRGQNARLRSCSGAAAGTAPRTPVVVFLPPAAAAAALPRLSRWSSILRGLPLPLPFLLLFFFFFCSALAPAAALGDTSPAEGHPKLPRRDTKHGPLPSPRTVRARQRKRRNRNRSRRGRRSGRTGTGIRRGTRRSNRRCGLTGRRGRWFGWLLAAAVAPGLALAGRG